MHRLVYVSVVRDMFLYAKLRDSWVCSHVDRGLSRGGWVYGVTVWQGEGT